MCTFCHRFALIYLKKKKNAASCVSYVAHIRHVPSLCYNNHVLHLLHVLYRKQILLFGPMVCLSSCVGQNGTCPPSMFLCDTSRCLPTSWQCDWEIDCSDMSDELDCCKFQVKSCGFLKEYLVNLEFALSVKCLSHFSARIHADICMHAHLPAHSHALLVAHCTCTYTFMQTCSLMNP